MNIRETIEQLTAVAEELPDGLDSQVKVHLCHGDHAEGVITGQVEVYDAGGFAAVRGHPHLDDGNTVVRPLLMGVDAELAGIAAGRPVRPGSRWTSATARRSGCRSTTGSSRCCPDRRPRWPRAAPATPT